MLKPIIAVEGKCAKAPAALEPPPGACAGAVELRDGLCAERGITQIASLLALLVIPEGERQTSLDRLPRGPSRVSGPALVQALHRVDAVRLFEVEHHDLSFSSERTREGPGALCHHRSGLQPTPAHRLATLLAFAHTYLAVVHDDALDLFDALMRTASSQATREGQQERLRTIHDLDAAAHILCEA